MRQHLIAHPECEWLALRLRGSYGKFILEHAKTHEAYWNRLIADEKAGMGWWFVMSYTCPPQD